MLKQLTAAERLASRWIVLFTTNTKKAPIRDVKFMAEYGKIDRQYNRMSMALRAEFDQIIHRKANELLRPKRERPEPGPEEDPVQWHRRFS